MCTFNMILATNMTTVGNNVFYNFLLFCKKNANSVNQTTLIIVYEQIITKKWIFCWLKRIKLKIAVSCSGLATVMRKCIPLL